MARKFESVSPHFYWGLMKRYAPSGTRISKRAPLPKVPVSRMEMPVMDIISRDRYMSSPEFWNRLAVEYLLFFIRGNTNSVILADHQQFFK